MAGYSIRGELPEEWRTYRLVKITGWTEEQILDARGHLLDWFLICEAAEREADEMRQRDADRRSRLRSGQ